MRGIMTNTWFKVLSTRKQTRQHSSISSRASRHYYSVIEIQHPLLPILQIAHWYTIILSKLKLVHFRNTYIFSRISIFIITFYIKVKLINIVKVSILQIHNYYCLQTHLFLLIKLFFY